MDHNKLSEGIKKSIRDTSNFEAFADMKIDTADFLDEIEGRIKCPICLKSRKFFCYNCYIPMPIIADKIPKIKLPMDIAVIKHAQEVDGKSTAVHAPILAPEFVKIYTYPDLPDTQKSILIFPSPEAEDAVEFMERVKKENGGDFPYKRVIFIDSTWNQTFSICNDPKVMNLPKVKLNGIESLFWRYQRKNPITHLATIEAIYHFCVIQHKGIINADYKGEYDNLLFFYKYMFFKIRHIYNPKSLLSYATRPYLQQENNTCV